ncbi:MAG: hypothetical protein Q4F21_14635 [Lachnospiraceae bacterium]|nr:hypothetical protein [Lachnospiraceae bacterium]
MNKKRNSMRMINMVVDFIHIGICIAIIALAVVVFFRPMQNTECYPVIFFLAAVLNFTSAYARMNRFRLNRNHSASGIAVLVLGILFFILAVISGVSIWG